MTIKLYFYLAMLLAVAMLIGGAGVYLHHKGYVAGVASMQKKLDAATLSRDEAVAQAKADDAVVARVKAQLDANAQAQATVDAQAAQAVNAARAQAADADRTLKAWMGAYAKALRDPDCQKASVLVCEPLRGF